MKVHSFINEKHFASRLIFDWVSFSHPTVHKMELILTSPIIPKILAFGDGLWCRCEGLWRKRKQIVCPIVVGRDGRWLHTRTRVEGLRLRGPKKFIGTSALLVLIYSPAIFALAHPKIFFFEIIHFRLFLFQNHLYFYI